MIFSLKHWAMMALVGMLALTATAPAMAHAVLLSTEPAENAMVEIVPEDFVLTFNEPVNLLTATLITPQGEQIGIDGASEGNGVRMVMPDALDEGTHVLSWRVVSVDGHPIGGATAFSLGVVTGAANVAMDADPVVTNLFWASKAVLYVALFFGLGSAAWSCFGALPTGARTRAAGVIGVGLVAAPLSLGLQGADALGRGAASLFDADTWAAGASTSYGMTVLILVAGLLMAGTSLTLRGTASLALAIAAWIAAGLALALSGHASAADPQWMTRPAVFLHIAGIVFWAGALLPLLVMLARRDDNLSAGLARFSAFIPFPVAVIIISGFTLALIQLGRDVSQWTSPYGLILATKLAIILVLFALAIWNRFHLTRPVLAGDGKAIGTMKAVIVAEIVLMLLVLGLVAGWRFTPPPRALAEAASVPVTFHIHTDAAMADIAIEPARPGSNAIAVYLMDTDFAPITPQEVSVSLSAPDLGIEAMTMPATQGDDGYWRVEDLTIPIAGNWKLDLEIRMSRFEMVRLTQDFTLD